MRNTTRLLDVLDRAETGPIVEELQWDMQLVPNAVMSLLAQHNIKMPAVGDAIVTTDDALADRLFDAGLALAEQLGAYCVSTSRRIQFTREEIRAALAVAPVEVTIGEGNDRATERKRCVEDCRPPFIKGGGVGTPLPEDLYLAVTQSYAQEPLVDAVINCTLSHVYGRELRSRTPWSAGRMARGRDVQGGVPARRSSGLALGCVENAVSRSASCRARRTAASARRTGTTSP